jgi:hypothetical protein
MAIHAPLPTPDNFTKLQESAIEAELCPNVSTIAQHKLSVRFVNQLQERKVQGYGHRSDIKNGRENVTMHNLLETI